MFLSNFKLLGLEFLNIGGSNSCIDSIILFVDVKRRGFFVVVYLEESLKSFWRVAWTMLKLTLAKASKCLFVCLSFSYALIFHLTSNHRSLQWEGSSKTCTTCFARSLSMVLESILVRILVEKALALSSVASPSQAKCEASKSSIQPLTSVHLLLSKVPSKKPSKTPEFQIIKLHN